MGGRGVPEIPAEGPSVMNLHLLLTQCGECVHAALIMSEVMSGEVMCLVEICNLEDAGKQETRVSVGFSRSPQSFWEALASWT